MRRMGRPGRIISPTSGGGDVYPIALAFLLESMRPFRLSPRALDRLIRLRHQTRDARELRRATAPLEVYRGESIDVAADRVGASTRSAYSWVEEAWSHAAFTPRRLQPDPGGSSTAAVNLGTPACTSSQGC